MTQDEVKLLLQSLAQIGAAVAAGTAPTSAATYALAAIIREVPVLFGIATIILSKNGPSETEMAEAHKKAVALLSPETIGRLT